jgi:predicted acetyltransferase
MGGAVRPSLTVEVVAEELGSSLRWATATTTRTTRGQGKQARPCGRRDAAKHADVPLPDPVGECDRVTMPRLTLPTTVVQDSYLQGETETAIAEGLPTGWLEEAAADFAGFVAQRRAVRELWGVPVAELWFVDGADYLGTVLIRHRLTPALERAGGHIGYHVVPGHRRRGHATQMLPQAKLVCRELGLREILVTCAEDNLGSRRVIEANGGALDRIIDGEALYWLATSQQGA